MGKSLAMRMTIGIVGGGAAGMSCALWLSQLGHQPVIIERGGKLGGHLLTIDRVNRWVLGFHGITSTELAQRFADHIFQSAVTVQLNSSLTGVATRPDGYRLEIHSGRQNLSLPVQALVIATGARVLGEEMFADLPGFGPALQSGLLGAYPLDHLNHLPYLKGLDIAVIGAGDNAHFTAKDLVLAGAHVHLVMRSQAKAQTKIRSEIMVLSNEGRITPHAGTVLAGFKLEQNGLCLALAKGGAASQWIRVARVFFRIGFAANSGFLAQFDTFSGLNKQAGYIITDAAKQTNLPGVYAIGDVANPTRPSVVAALADGAAAAQAIGKEAA